jgi:hypothetical protein
MIRHGVDDERHVVGVQRFYQSTQIVLGADLRIETVVIGDVIAMGTASSGLQDGRGVQM